MMDCIETTVALLSQEGAESMVMIGETVLRVPTHWVHLSQGRTGVWCFVPEFMPGGAMATYTDTEGRTRAIAPKIPTRDNTRCAFYLSFN